MDILYELVDRIMWGFIEDKSDFTSLVDGEILASYNDWYEDKVDDYFICYNHGALPPEFGDTELSLSSNEKNEIRNYHNNNFERIPRERLTTIIQKVSIHLAMEMKSSFVDRINEIVMSKTD